MTRRRHIAAAVGLLAGSACGHQPVAIRTTGTTSTSSPATTETANTTEAPATTAPPTSAPAVTAPPSPPSTAGAEPTPPPTIRRTTTTEATSGEPARAGREELLGCIRSYEQNDNPAKGPTGYASDTGNGFYGAYQFTSGTWSSVGGSGNPAHASAAEQDARAWALYEARGLQPWPTPAARCA